MQEVKAFNEKRAEIYWWFSSLICQRTNRQRIGDLP